MIWQAVLISDGSRRMPQAVIALSVILDDAKLLQVTGTRADDPESSVDDGV
jgi:hypothetical protein